MNFEHHDNIESSKSNLVETKFKNFFSEVFLDNTESEKRFENICNKLKKFLESSEDNQVSEEEICQITNSLKEACLLEDKEEFIEQGFASLGPILTWHDQDPRLFEAKLRENQTAFLKLDSLNEVLTYQRRGEDIHLHVSPGETLTLSEKRAFVRDGFNKLAKILIDDEKIKNIIATSWIVGANPGLLEKLGFTIDGEISEEEKARARGSIDKPIARAHICREDFLKIYNTQ